VTHRSAALPQLGKKPRGFIFGVGSPDRHLPLVDCAPAGHQMPPLWPQTAWFFQERSISSGENQIFEAKSSDGCSLVPSRTTWSLGFGATLCGDVLL